MKNFFDGMYYKHQKGENTVSVIAGISRDHAFIQVITNKASQYFTYPLSAYENKGIVKIGNSVFGRNGIRLNIRQNGAEIRGQIRYSGMTPLKYDIMGPFQYLPMQCRHRVISMRHRLAGSMVICGKSMNFTGGIGYIEGDSGTSFPRSYTWIQCGDFPGKAAIMASVADIPFMGLHFRGCICAVVTCGREYRLATYLGVKILRCDERRIILRQGNLRLEIAVDRGSGHKLMAPETGAMTREIRERIVCGARFLFSSGGRVLLDEYSRGASFEYVGK